MKEILILLLVLSSIFTLFCFYKIIVISKRLKKGKTLLDELYEKRTELSILEQREAFKAMEDFYE